MANKFLIAVSARQVSASHWLGERLAGCDIFPYSEDGLSAFKDYLAKSHKQPVYMVVDAVEEDYRVESLPHSYGSDRTEMVNRKLKQHYRNSPYCSAQLIDRDTGKRRDDRYLLCGLTNPGLIAAWVLAVTERELPLAGIYLLPTVSQRLVEKLQIKQTNLLLVAINSSGLRLTFFRDQKLRVSRLARIDSTSPQANKSYAEEISNTRLYLHALRIMPLDEQLSVMIIDSDDSLTELAAGIARDSPTIDCRRLGRQEIVDSLGISAPALDSSADALYLHLLGMHPPGSNLAPPSVTLGYRLHRARRGISLFTAATAFAITVWSAFNWYQIIDTNIEIKNDTENAARQTAQLQLQYLETTRQFPETPTSAENMERAVQVAQKFGATTRSPEALLAVVGEALDRNPAITLRRLGWKYGRVDSDPDFGKSARPAASAPTDGPRRQHSLIDGEVYPFEGDYRAANATIKRFIDTLAKQPRVAEVKLVKAPLNVNPGLTLSGNTTESREIGKAEFKLLLVLKQTP